MPLSILRRLGAGSACALLALLAATPGAAAGLTLRVLEQGNAVDIYTTGSTTLAAPRNATIAAAWKGYWIDWDAPAARAGQEVAAYTVYRIPGPDTPGDLRVTELPSRWTAFYDQPGDGTYIYFVTATFGSSPSSSSPSSQSESVSSMAVTTGDLLSNYPRCNVLGVTPNPPYYESHLGCLFP